jgi:two-component system response regulator PilR (NtrC family)
MKARVLVVDDERTARQELCEALDDAGMEAVGAGDAREALAAVEAGSFDVCVSDIRMPGMDGIELLKQLSEDSPETMVIMITAYGDMETAIEALRSGATDYVLKPLLFEDIIAKVNRLVEYRKLAREVASLRRITEARVHEQGIVGNSEAMQEVSRLITRVAGTGSSVLITGESGTGKELIARAIHQGGDRVNQPFVPINCAAIPETLLESELFGHTKGAFTGAVATKEGLMLSAAEGTIFLDEIGDMPMAVQAKLLRAIESREIQPVGSVRRIPIHARIIAATNKDLRAQIEKDLFREDLYYRLVVVEIRVPPLRERPDDIPLLVKHFVSKYNDELKRNVAGVESEAMRRFVGYTWRGNIRELENAIERAMIFADDDIIRAQDLPEDLRAAVGEDPQAAMDLRAATRKCEREHISMVIRSCEGDKREAARLLGLSLSTLYRKLELQTEEEE